MAEIVTMGPMNPIPISDLVNIGEEYSCSRSLFSFVNRSLNAIGLRANVVQMSSGLIYFVVEERND